MFMQQKRLVSAPMLLLLSCCGFPELAYRETNPVIGDQIRYNSLNPFSTARYSTHSTTASRRTIFVKFADEKHKSEIVCAEPPPDALEAFASAVAAAASVSGQTSSVPASISTEYARGVATSASPLLYRSQGLQFYRDTLHHYCLMSMNGILKDEEYLERIDQARKDAMDLATKELDAVKIAAGRPQRVVSARSPTAQLGSTASPASTSTSPKPTQ